MLPNLIRRRSLPRFYEAGIAHSYAHSASQDEWKQHIKAYSSYTTIGVHSAHTPTISFPKSSTKLIAEKRQTLLELCLRKQVSHTHILPFGVLLLCQTCLAIRSRKDYVRSRIGSQPETVYLQQNWQTL
ncbi:hypothetical protein RSOL_017200 [Rhizoctonia solani AG-3 Rhs1AP]|uniref:Uncharacterized protein n=1 Tax=Rhizoctonia solani AG-3 Rhs1AP TaxID=1086054 RepID=X8IVR0_9AGAM|nr:hypothetical protein RSOL_017200 [Rhizoctonia solani AG-3 Rhs1AP]